MISFKNDYAEGAHINILNALTETNATQCEGYGLDIFSEQAIVRLKNVFEADNSDIHFISGGTQTNLTAISAFLRPHQAVISTHTGHVFVHETGAIECTGHKVISKQSKDGKLTVELIEQVLAEHVDEHMVQPKLIYLSNATEVGTVYSLDELRAIYLYAKVNDLIVYLDGARLGQALMSDDSNLKASDLTKYTDAFYIGATKNGGLLGEALVINKDELKKDFRFLLKQRGALLAKGRLLGIQFDELFKESLYFDLAKHANQMAELLAKHIHKQGFDFLIPPATNQIFPILPNDKIKQLSEDFGFYIWEAVDDQHSAIRLVTSWMTQKESIEALIQAI